MRQMTSSRATDSGSREFGMRRCKTRCILINQEDYFKRSNLVGVINYLIVWFEFMLSLISA